MILLDWKIPIEKCSSPTGDGNDTTHHKVKNIPTVALRNVVPRQGTETKPKISMQSKHRLLRNVVPRQGTETFLLE